jgi:hypothetical protein
MQDSDAEVSSLDSGHLEDNVALALSTSASLIPVLGGPVSNLINGFATRRQQRRFVEVINGLNERIRNAETQVDEEYVRSEEFEELLEETLRRVVRERNEEKRQIYRDFLAKDMLQPDGSYDEKLRFLRTLEEVQVDHIRTLKALMAAPDPEASGGFSGSPMQTLEQRLPGMESERISDLVDQLNRMALTNMRSLMTMMTASGAQQLSHAITPYGQRFVRFL